MVLLIEELERCIVKLDEGQGVIGAECCRVGERCSLWVESQANWEGLDHYGSGAHLFDSFGVAWPNKVKD